MLKRTLGSTGLDVTVLGYGAMELRHDEAPTDDQAVRLLNAVLDAGINFIDTSPDYGLSEQRIDVSGLALWCERPHADHREVTVGTDPLAKGHVHVDTHVFHTRMVRNVPSVTLSLL